MDGSPTPPSPPGSPAIDRKLSPRVLLLIAILAMVFFIFGLLNLLAQNLLRLRRARRVSDAAAAADGSSPTAFQGQLQQLFHLHDAGVDQAFIDALPIFPYRAISTTAAKDEAFDCAVCLCEFADDHQLRLLPTCGHAFHVPCIDAWLLSHSTCPLCRGSILAGRDYDYSSPSPPSSASLFLLHHSSYGLAETAAGDGGGDPGARDGDESPKDDDAEEVVEVKLGKLRCVDGNASARDLVAADVSNGRGSLGQRRCLSMGSYEYVMDDHAALRVTIKATTTPTPKRRPARSSRRQHALSACDLGCTKKAGAGAWETAVVTEAAANLSRDSFSTSKIWMASGRRPGPAAAEPAGDRRAASFRWPAMASGCKRQRRDEEPCDDVEAGGSGDSGAVSSIAVAEERPPSVARAAISGSPAGGGREAMRDPMHVGLVQHTRLDFFFLLLA